MAVLHNVNSGTGGLMEVSLALMKKSTMNGSDILILQQNSSKPKLLYDNFIL